MQVTDECGKFGKVEKVVIYQEQRSERPGDAIVKIFVLFSQNSGLRSQTALACVDCIDLLEPWYCCVVELTAARVPWHQGFTVQKGQASEEETSWLEGKGGKEGSNSSWPSVLPLFSQRPAQPRRPSMADGLAAGK